MCVCNDVMISVYIVHPYTVFLPYKIMFPSVFPVNVHLFYNLTI